jgi:hypothetical protein
MGLRDFPLTFAGGDSQQIRLDGNFFHILEADDDLFISIDDTPFVKRLVGSWQEGGFNKLVIKSSVAQTVRITAGYGRYGDNTDNVAVTVNTAFDPGATIANPVQVTVPAAASAQVLAGNANRLHAIIQSSNVNNPAIIARLGGAAVAANSGLELTAGTGIPPIRTTAALYVYNPGPDNIIICAIEGIA